MRLDPEEFKGYLLLKGFVYEDFSLISPDNQVHFELNNDGTINYIVYHFPLYKKTFITYRNDKRLFTATVLVNDTYDDTTLIINFLTKPSHFDIFADRILAKSIDDDVVFRIYLHRRELAHYIQNGELTLIL